MFKRELYAAVSLITAALYCFALHHGLPNDWAAFGAIGIGFVLRLLAVRFKVGTAHLQLSVCHPLNTPVPGHIARITSNKSAIRRFLLASARE